MAVPVNFFHLDLALGWAGAPEAAAAAGLSADVAAAAAATAAGSTVVGGESRAGVVVVVFKATGLSVFGWSEDNGLMAGDRAG